MTQQTLRSHHDQPACANGASPGDAAMKILRGVVGFSTWMLSSAARLRKRSRRDSNAPAASFEPMRQQQDHTAEARHLSSALAMN